MVRQCAPMKSSTLLAKLCDLEIITSWDRPQVSNDNPTLTDAGCLPQRRQAHGLPLGGSQEDPGVQGGWHVAVLAC